jgi:hypothetical protein
MYYLSKILPFVYSSISLRGRNVDIIMIMFYHKEIPAHSHKFLQINGISKIRD